MAAEHRSEYPSVTAVAKAVADQLVPYSGSQSGWSGLAGENAEEKAYPGARHEIFNETNQDEVLDDVVAFVRRHLA